MKKLLTILIFVLLAFSGFSQRRTSIPWLTSQDITNTRYFIYRGDTIDFSAFGAGINDVVFEDNYLKFFNNQQIIDSVYFEYAQEIDTFLIVGDSIKLKLTDSNARYIDINFVRSKLDTVVTNNTLTGQGTPESPLGIDSIILSNTTKSVYSITLPANSTVQGRCNSALEGTDYPDGWVVSVGTNAADIKITHNLGRSVAYVSVWSISGNSKRQLFGNAAYAGIFSETNNILLIESLATVQTAIAIQIVYAQ